MINVSRLSTLQRGFVAFVDGSQAKVNALREWWSSRASVVLALTAYQPPPSQQANLISTIYLSTFPPPYMATPNLQIITV